MVGRVRVEYGTVALGPDDDAANDVAVMDDFIMASPRPPTRKIGRHARVDLWMTWPRSGRRCACC